MSVDEHGVPLDMVWTNKPEPYLQGEGLRPWTAKDCTYAGEHAELNPLLTTFCYLRPAPLRRNGTVDRIALFHYGSKSTEDFQAKMKRGSGMSLATKGKDYIEKMIACAPFPFWRVRPFPLLARAPLRPPSLIRRRAPTGFADRERHFLTFALLAFACLGCAADRSST